MPASTRASTGNSKPRLIQQIENVVAPKKRTTTANTSKPRANTTTTGRVAKPKATTTTGPRTKVVKKHRTPAEKTKDKVVGTAEKMIGEVEGKPGKKAAGTRKVNGTGKGATRRAI